MNRNELFSLSGRRILVTGAAGHLGHALCRYLVDDGAIVLAVDVDRRGLAALELEFASYGERLVTFFTDLSDDQQRGALAEAVAAKVEALDGVVFAAALVGTSELEGWNVDFAEQSISTWQKALELNLTAPFHLSQLLAGLLRAGDRPSIVNIGSIYGSLAPDSSLYEGLDMSNPAAYAASKGGLLQLSRWLAATLSPTIRVNTVSPGGLVRNQKQVFVERYNKKTLLGRMAHEEDVVPAIVFLLGPGAQYVTGATFAVDGGFGVS